MVEAPRSATQPLSPSPSSRTLTGITAIKLLRLDGDTSAQAALGSMGWQPPPPGELAGSGPWCMAIHPREMLALGSDAAALSPLLSDLAAGRSESALAVDVSESLVVFELQGHGLDTWLSHLVDASTIPGTAGCATRCRLVDVPVLLLRMQATRLWLIGDRPLAPYLQDWLAHAHAGAFPEPPRCL